ncbi:MAG: long-chain fatty acid--CoA ligase [Deltaproteobacteria bacterium]|nr:long-chain fatty acid--CoA ligase [Deltaproteobacteria bacterium]
MDPKYHVDETKPWFRPESGWPQEVFKNMEFPRMTLGQMFDEAVREHGNQPIGWFLGSWMTYSQMARHVDALAIAFHNHGFRKGDVIALLLPNSFQYIMCYYACAKLGVVVSGVNPTYKPGEILHQLKTVNAKGLVVLDALYQGSVDPILSRSGIQFLVHTGIADFLPPLKQFLGKLLKKIPTGPVPKHSIPLSSLLKTRGAAPAVDLDPEADTATYIMTGGTTGVPKAAVLSHFNCVSNVIQSLAWLYKLQPGMCNLGVLPFFHSFAMTCVMNVTIRAGGWIMIYPKPPAMDELCVRVETLGVDKNTIFLGAEILFQKMAEYVEANPGKHSLENKLLHCISGAGPLHRPVQEKFERMTNASLVEGYGLTESSPVVSAGQFYGKRKIGTVGLPFTGTEWKILDIETGTKVLPPGEENIGELAIAGPQVMVGYLNRDEETAETVVTGADGKRWLMTGDLGFMDEHGQVTLRDRKKQLIKYKGYSVFPKEVEELVGGHPMVSEVAVHGLPDPEAGEVIKAWVVLRPDSKGKISEEELLAWSKENMTHYKVPRHIEFRDDIPKTPVGKVLRRELAEQDPIYKKYKK